MTQPLPAWAEREFNTLLKTSEIPTPTSKEGWDRWHEKVQCLLRFNQLNVADLIEAQKGEKNHNLKQMKHYWNVLQEYYREQTENGRFSVAGSK